MFTRTFPEELYIHADEDITLFVKPLTECPVTHHRFSEDGIAY